MTDDFDEAIQRFQDFLSHHDKGRSIFEQNLDACTNTEDLKQLLRRIIRVYFFETSHLFRLSVTNLESIKNLREAITACCESTGQYPQLKKQLDLTTEAVVKMIAEIDKAQSGADIYG